MTLVLAPCPQCEKEISSQALSCPNCGGRTPRASRLYRYVIVAVAAAAAVRGLAATPGATRRPRSQTEPHPLRAVTASQADTQARADSAALRARLDSLGAVFDAQAGDTTLGLRTELDDLARKFNVPRDTAQYWARVWMVHMLSKHPNLSPYITLGAVSFAVERDRVRAPLQDYMITVARLLDEYGGDEVAIRSEIVENMRRYARVMGYRCAPTRRCVMPKP